MSYLRTAILLAAMTALFMGIGFLLGGQSGMVIALLVAAAMNLFAYWNSDKMVLSMYGAREVDARSASELYALVGRLASAAGLPMPRVFIMENPQPNAFATGRNPENAAVAATTGLLKMLSRDEIEGVMAHELAHVKRWDCLTQLLGQTACSLYWFNPVVWLASRELRIERERACDDQVIDLGTKASDYAGHLLDMARTFTSSRCSSLATLAIARR